MLRGIDAPADGGAVLEFTKGPHPHAVYLTAAEHAELARMAGGGPQHAGGLRVAAVAALLASATGPRVTWGEAGGELDGRKAGIDADRPGYPKGHHSLPERPVWHTALEPEELEEWQSRKHSTDVAWAVRGGPPEQVATSTYDARGVPGASRKAAAALTRRQARLAHGLGSRYFFVHSPA